MSDDDFTREQDERTDLIMKPMNDMLHALQKAQEERDRTDRERAEQSQSKDTPAQEIEVGAYRTDFYDTPERRQAILQQMEARGISERHREVMRILMEGQGAPPGVERRATGSRGAHMRERGNERGPERGLGRER